MDEAAKYMLGLKASLLTGIPLIGIGLAIMNPLLIMLGIACLVGMVVLFIKMWKMGEKKWKKQETLYRRGSRPFVE